MPDFSLVGATQAIVTLVKDVAITLCGSGGLLYLLKGKTDSAKQKQATQLTAEGIVAKAGQGKLSEVERSALLSTLEGRLRTVHVLSWLLGAAVCVSFASVAYSLIPPQRETPSSLAHLTVETVSIHGDPWLTHEPLLLADANGLVDAAQIEEKAGQIKTYCLIRAASGKFGASTGRATPKFTQRVTYPASDYELVLRAVRVSPSDAGDLYLSLNVDQDEGARVITIPPSAADDSLLLFGCLSKKSDDKMPPDLNSIIKMEPIR